MEEATLQVASAIKHLALILAIIGLSINIMLFAIVTAINKRN